MSSAQPVHFAFKDIRFAVDIKDKKTKSVTEKVIIDGISGDVLPGESVVIMGPTGGGKTSLLDALVGRIQAKEGRRISGERLVNGQPVQTNAFRRYAGYVEQFDQLLPSLTVRETLEFSAAMGLEPSVYKARGKEIVDNILVELGLQSIEHARVGGDFFGGISGGSRKRLSIGVEMVTEPSMLLLDEPTTGIDSASAYQVYRNIRDLAIKKNRTIVATLHQPSSEIYNMYDKVLLLSRGRLVYFGDAQQALKFVGGLGFPVPALTNPADHLLDLINEDFQNEYEEGHIERIIQAYKDSGERSEMEGRASGNQELAALTPPQFDSLHANPLPVQVGLLLGRSFKESRRNPLVYMIRVIMYAMFGLVLGSAYWEVGDGEDDDSLRNVGALIFFAASFYSYMAVSVLPTMGQARLTFTRERVNGAYGPFSFVISDTLLALPWLFLTALVAGAVLFFMAQLNDNGARFIVLVIVMFATLTAAEATVALISTLVDSSLAALAIGSAVFGILMLNSGFMVPVDSIPEPWLAVHYISFTKYSLEALMYNQYAGGVYSDVVNFPPSGDVFIDSRYSIDDDLRVRNIIILFGIAAALRLMQALTLQKYATGKK